MSDMIIKKIIGGPGASLPEKTSPKTKQTSSEFNKVLNKSIQELDKTQNLAGEAVAKAQSGQLNQLSDVQEALKQTNKMFKDVMQSRQKVIDAYQQIISSKKEEI